MTTFDGRRLHAIGPAEVIVAGAFAEGAGSVTFRSSNDAALLGIVVVPARLGGESPLPGPGFDGMIDFVPQSQRGRLPPAAVVAQGRVRIPRDRVGIGIEVVVVAMVDRQAIGSRGAMFEPRE